MLASSDVGYLFENGARVRRIVMDPYWTRIFEEPPIGSEGVVFDRRYTPGAPEKARKTYFVSGIEGYKIPVPLLECELELIK
jgi:hypothetical protein